MSLSRQPTISNQLIDYVMSQISSQGFVNALQNCLGEQGNVRMNYQTGDVYWNSNDTLIDKRPRQHLSIHRGGSQTNRGALHIECKFPEQNLTINFRIYIYLYSQLESYDPNLARFGDFIYMDTSDFYRINSENERIICNYILNTVGNCLNTFLTPYILEMQRYAGNPEAIKVILTNKKRNKKTNKKTNKKRNKSGKKLSK